MQLRHGWLLAWLLCLGCHTLVSVDPPDLDAEPAERLWEQGQAAMREGKAEEAILCYRQSLSAGGFQRTHLSLAAAYLENGDPASACDHLGKYLDAHPDNPAVRAHYAELLFRVRRASEAKVQFERSSDEALDNEDAVRQRLHCHSRLMEIAESEDDVYSAHLHRGIGLCLLAQNRAALGDPKGDLPVEGLLCKAAGELGRARLLGPEEARPCWHLYAVWRQLAEPQQARRWLRAALDDAPFSFLTAGERQALELARRGHEKIGISLRQW
jgi:tetratricopeptide (TPR) repeat protein